MYLWTYLQFLADLERVFLISVTKRGESNNNYFVFPRRVPRIEQTLQEQLASSQLVCLRPSCKRDSELFVCQKALCFESCCRMMLGV